MSIAPPQRTSLCQPAAQGRRNRVDQQAGGKLAEKRAREIITSGGWAPGAGVVSLQEVGRRKAVLDALWVLPGCKCVDVWSTGRGGETIQLAHGRMYIPSNDTTNETNGISRSPRSCVAGFAAASCVVEVGREVPEG